MAEHTEGLSQSKDGKFNEVDPRSISSMIQPTEEKAPDAQQADLSSPTAVQIRENENINPNPDSDPKRKASMDQMISKPGRRSSIDPHEAVRRGLSFGPIKKSGLKQPSTGSILKSKSKSPSSRLATRAMSASSDAPSSTEVGQLKKDDYPSDAEAEAATESSDDEASESSGDESSGTERTRGRKPDTVIGSEPGKQPKVTFTPPDSEGFKQPSAKRFVVHPNTNFDQRVDKVGRPASPNTSDSEEINDIRRAQRLHINISPLDNSVPHRVIQTMIRGDYTRMQEEEKEGIRRLRTYLVATDLSSEAAYALEWTIGTVLRDGDTLMAVYAVDEEVGTGVAGECLPIGEGGKAIQDTTAIMEKMTIASQKQPLMSLSSPLTKAGFRSSSRKSSAANSTDSRALSKAEQERTHAIEKLSETCLRFLRKTKLQVRLAIEVIHCKSPKYMVTEAVGVILILTLIVWSY